MNGKGSEVKSGWLLLLTTLVAGNLLGERGHYYYHYNRHHHHTHKHSYYY